MINDFSGVAAKKKSRYKKTINVLFFPADKDHSFCEEKFSIPHLESLLGGKMLGIPIAEKDDAKIFLFYNPDGKKANLKFNKRIRRVSIDVYGDFFICNWNGGMRDFDAEDEVEIVNLISENIRAVTPF